VIAFASERVPLMTVFGCGVGDVHELEPGTVAVMKKEEEGVGCSMKVAPFAQYGELRPCSFERIYFSRSNDPDIYRERKALGEALVPQIVERIGNDLEHTVFSFIPNTAEVAYHGMMDGLRKHRRDEVKLDILAAAQEGKLDEKLIDDLILRNWPRGEKIAHKDIKLRTFISQEKGRDQMVSHVYDITYGVVQPGDNLVVMDDSIVRGTTLRKSLLKILARTNPKKIVIASTAPQIRYPDCYGIDMSELGKFIAFQAAIRLLEKRTMHRLIVDTYHACLAELEKARSVDMINAVKAIYDPFSAEEISTEISEMVVPEDIPWHGEVEVVFQNIENLHASIPIHNGDWYFTGNYPTPGGTKIANRAFVQFYEGDARRPYDVLI